MKDIQQLIKKNSQEGRYEDIFPKTFIDAITDKESGTSLEDILAMFNMLFLSYNGSRSQTRLQVPSSLRREGLWVTYVLYDKTVVTEWYNAEAIDDVTFGNSTNWRDGSNSLVGDISISSDGYWVINGEVTNIKAQGITPMLRVGINNHLQVSYTNGSSWVDISTNPVYTQFRVLNNKLQQSIDLGNTYTYISEELAYMFQESGNKLQMSKDLGNTWEDVSDYIAAWFRFTGTTGSSQADNVGKIQISRDNGVTWSDLSGEFTNSLHIKGYVATVGALPSSAVQGDIYGVGPTYDPADTGQTNPIYELYVKDSTGWVNNGRFTSITAGVVQVTGQSTTEVMSQKAVTDELTAINSDIADLELNKIDNPEGWYDNFSVSDENGNAILDLNSGISLDKYGNIETKAIKSETSFASEVQICDSNKKVILDLKSGLLVDRFGVVKSLAFSSDRIIDDTKYSKCSTDLLINKRLMQMPLMMMSHKMVDKSNRFVVSFNGDSILGSQLDDITHSAEYNTGAYPPNMSKNIMARMFYDEHKFDGEDTVFRNLEHSDWTKNGFSVNKGKGDKTKESNFNELEIWGCASEDDYAQISVNGYEFFKLIWSRASTLNLWECSLTVSIDGGAFITPTLAGISLPDNFGKADTNHRELQVYSICNLDATKTYVFKISPTSNYGNVTFWGCEYWNNPRIDVVVEAFSGTTAKTQVEKMQDSYCSIWHKPMFIISDVLVKNDESYIIYENDTVDIWMKSNATLYNLCRENGIPLLLISPHQVTTEILVYSAAGLGVSFGNPLIDIIKSLIEDGKTSAYIVNSTDGQHLSNVGNYYYFSKVENIFS